MLRTYPTTAARQVFPEASETNSAAKQLLPETSRTFNPITVQHIDDDSVLTFERTSSSAILPNRASCFSAGYDLFSSQEYSVIPGAVTIIETGINVGIPDWICGTDSTQLERIDEQNPRCKWCCRCRL